MEAALTFLNAVLMWVLLVHCLPFISTCDTLNTLVKMVLHWRAALGLFALCRLKLAMPTTLCSHRDKGCRLTLLKLLFRINHLLFLFLFGLITSLILLLLLIITLANPRSRFPAYFVVGACITFVRSGARGILYIEGQPKFSFGVLPQLNGTNPHPRVAGASPIRRLPCELEEARQPNGTQHVLK
jgi:hypothetical protein